jgi:hypothetical protein
MLNVSIQQSSTQSFSSFNTTPDDEISDGALSTNLAIKIQSIAAPRKPQLLPRAASPIVKNTADLPWNVFTRFFSSLTSLTSSQASNNQAMQAAPIPKGVFAIQTNALDVENLKSKMMDTVTNSSTPPLQNERGSNNQSIEAVWLPSTSVDHNNRKLLKAANDRKLLKMIMGRAKKLPQTSGKFACNHIMVNTERVKKRVPPLTRYRDLDRVAREHARAMADENMVRHMDGPTYLQARILERKDMDISADDERLFFPRLGVNIARGKNVEGIHKLMMANSAERNNVLDKRFTTLGMGTARAEDGMIYLCQVFGGQ